MNSSFGNGRIVNFEEILPHTKKQKMSFQVTFEHSFK